MTNTDLFLLMRHNDLIPQEHNAITSAKSNYSASHTLLTGTNFYSLRSPRHFNTGISRFIALRFIALQRYFFLLLQIEGLRQTSMEQVYWQNFSNSICSLHGSVSRYHILVILAVFQLFFIIIDQLMISNFSNEIY